MATSNPTTTETNNPQSPEFDEQPRKRARRDSVLMQDSNPFNVLNPVETNSNQPTEAPADNRNLDQPDTTPTRISDANVAVFRATRKLHLKQEAHGP